MLYVFDLSNATIDDTAFPMYITLNTIEYNTKYYDTNSFIFFPKHMELHPSLPPPPLHDSEG